MKWDLQGTVMQILNIELKPGEKIVSESGKMMYMSDNIKMETRALGGFWKSLKRKFAHESFFLVEFSPQGGTGIVAFASEVPGKIIPAKLQAGEELICQKDAFLCSDDGVQFDATFTETRRWIFGRRRTDPDESEGARSGFPQRGRRGHEA
ncbi:hypothetical protein ES703_02433 [subsurface metagenome]